MKRLLFPSLMVLAAGCSLQANPVFTLDPPSGNVTGLAGTDTGWGFTMTSDSVLYISSIVSSLIDQSNPSLGLYTDFIGAEGGPVNGVLAPGASPWTQTFDDISQGVGAFSIDPSAPVGATDQGFIEVQYATYSEDPTSAEPAPSAHPASWSPSR